MNKPEVLSQRPIWFALATGTLLALLWVVLVTRIQRGMLSDMWMLSSLLFTGLFPMAMVLLCGYLTLELNKLLTLGASLAPTLEGQRHYELFKIVRRVNRIMGRQNALQTVFDDITLACLEAFACQQVSLMLLDERSNELTVYSAAGTSKEVIVGQKQKVGIGVAGRVAEEWKPLILGETFDTDAFSGFEKKALPISAAMVLPILLREDLVGVLNITNRVGGHTYTEEDLQGALLFAEITAVCIRHAQQTHWMRETIQRLSGTGNLDLQKGIPMV